MSVWKSAKLLLGTCYDSVQRKHFAYCVLYSACSTTRLSIVYLFLRMCRHEREIWTENIIRFYQRFGQPRDGRDRALYPVCRRRRYEHNPVDIACHVHVCSLRGGGGCVRFGPLLNRVIVYARANTVHTRLFPVTIEYVFGPTPNGRDTKTNFQRRFYVAVSNGENP